MIAGIPSFSGYGHGGRGKVLHLFQMKIKAFGDNSQFCHVLFLTAGMTGNEIRNQLLSQSFFAVDTVEYFLEFLELAERGFAHDTQYPVTGMFRSYFKTTADVAGY